MRRAGLMFLLSCALISSAAGAPAWAAVTLLLTGIVVHTVGELWQAAGGFELSNELAPGTRWGNTSVSSASAWVWPSRSGRSCSSASASSGPSRLVRGRRAAGRRRAARPADRAVVAPHPDPGHPSRTESVTRLKRTS
ncbi:hypothetical protein NKG94_01680 [Micromonospora sp. M12]